MKGSRLLALILAIGLIAFLVVGAEASSANRWGWSNHHGTVSQAVHITPPKPTITPLATPTPTLTPTPLPTATSTTIATATFTPMATATPTNTATPTGALYTFEDGTLQGWSRSGSVSSVANSTDHAYAGSHSLKVVLANTSDSSAGFAQVNPQGAIGQGDTFGAYVYSATSVSTTASLFIQDQAYHQTTGTSILLAAGWNHLTYAVPSGASLPLRLIGVQFGGNTPSSPTLYIDEVGKVGGTPQPTSTPVQTATNTPTQTATPIPSTPTPTATATNTSTPTGTAQPTATLTNTPQPTATATATATSSNPPLLYGSNATNFEQNLTNHAAEYTALGLKSDRIAGDSPTYSQDLQTAYDQGWTVIVILRGHSIPDTATRITTDVGLINTAMSIFHNDSSRIYVEFGNESDLGGWDKVAYTNAWNATMPSVEAAAPNAKYGGPVNFQSSPIYIAYFVEYANPQPDFISWHEYSCNSSESASACLADATQTSRHVPLIRAAIQANPTHNTVPPMAVTEWNYAPDNGVTTDPKADDPTFMYNWTSLLLQDLRACGIFMSNHFPTAGKLELINPSTGATNPAGQAFSDRAHAQ
jgi:hypothetical protein